MPIIMGFSSTTWTHYGFSQIIKKGKANMDYKIIQVNGHYEAYDNKGNCICSGDSLREITKEIEKMQKGK